MSEIKPDGGPAFPSENERQTGPNSYHSSGMSLRAYAAIHLKQPDSGIDWLDKMIVAAKRDGLAATGGFELNWDGVRGRTSPF